MYKGCKKNIIHIKNTGSKYFEQAYFILKNDLRDDEAKCVDMISEANRIVEKSVNSKAKKTHSRKGLLPFSLGVSVSTFIYTLILFLLQR